MFIRNVLLYECLGFEELGTAATSKLALVFALDMRLAELLQFSERRSNSSQATEATLDLAATYFGISLPP